MTYNGKKYRVTTIGIYAFEGCKGLTSVAIPKSVKAIGEGAFERCYGLASVTIPSSVTVIGPTAFYLCTGLTSVTIPSSVSTIGTWAFSFCDKLEKIDVEKGNSNYSSENGVLFDASKKTLVRCPGGIKGEYIIPKGVTAIEKSAFLGCTGLTSVSIPKSVTTIGESAFADCTGLACVTILNPMPPSIKGYFIYGVSRNIPLYVPAESVEKYKAAEG
ncbi:MAG: leucine-rich repeat domain-containing protein, partial [Paludibacteraceae bacterium]|nr:leucine-rich repeat domain-containing protein [Paludibacteraceae bacterium]